jgi:hypothetical protein
MVEWLRSLLEQAQFSLDHAICSVDTDLEAARDDMFAVRLLISTATVALGAVSGLS